MINDNTHKMSWKSRYLISIDKRPLTEVTKPTPFAHARKQKPRTNVGKQIHRAGHIHNPFAYVANQHVFAGYPKKSHIAVLNNLGQNLTNDNRNDFSGRFICRCLANI